MGRYATARTSPCASASATKILISAWFNPPKFNNLENYQDPARFLKFYQKVLVTNSTELMTVDKGPVKHLFALSTNMNAAINEMDKVQMNTTENPLNNVSYQFETNSTIWVVSTPVTTPVTTPVYSIIRTTT